MALLFKNATLVTMNPRREILRRGYAVVEGDRITALGAGDYPGPEERFGRVLDARGRVLIPGLIQTHVHLCQSLFRGQADDLALLDWLRARIWPLEGAHDADSVYYSAMLGCGELFRGGTTAIVDMETVHHADAAFEAVRQNGMRVIMGKVMMDHGEGVPATLRETTEDSLETSLRLLERWHGAEGGRIRYAFNPRFAVSCTEELLRTVAGLARQYGVKIHTHASESRGEIELVERERGMRNLIYLDRLGLTGPDLILAHCIWLDEAEMDVLAETHTKVAHCPSSNLKLASGIADIPAMQARGITTSLGADGAPCNNNLDMFHEMRTAALIQKPRHGSTAMPAARVFEMATLGGARAMGLEHEIGSLEVGKKADLALIDLDALHTQPTNTVSLYSQLVYQAKSSDVVLTVVDGRIVMENGRLLSLDEAEVKRRCNEAILRVARRAGLL